VFSLRRSLWQLRLISESFSEVRRKYGFIRAARLAIGELGFDLLNGTDTCIDLGSESMHGAGGHPAHAGSNPVLFAEAVACLGIDERDSVFLDFGSGKGRALLLASHHGFRKAIGVEISAALCAIARRNIRVYRKRKPGVTFEVHCADAAGFEVPADVNIGFLYNPFGPETVSAVIDRIAESLARSARDFYVIYLHPTHRGLFLKAGFRIVGEQRAEALVLFRRTGAGHTSGNL
jgi:SAM-dependent methyltransferase